MEEKLKKKYLYHDMLKIFEPSIDQREEGVDQMTKAKTAANREFRRIILKGIDICERKIFFGKIN